MVARNMKLDYITDDSKRKATFRKRKQGIIKKINEITILCGIDACGIIYDENNDQSVVYPSKEGVQMVLDRFRNFPESEQRKVMMDHEDFLGQSIEKSQVKLNKQKENSKKKEMNDIICQFIHTGDFNGNVSESDLEDLSLLIDKNLKEVKQVIKWIQDQIESQDED